MFYCYLISFILSWGALSTYHKWLNPIFHKPKTDAYWFNWLAHGFFIGFAFSPFIWAGIHWYSILIRSIVLGLTMMWWSENNDDVLWEAGGRGALIILTLPILLI